MLSNHKAEIDIFEAIGLTAGEDWRFAKDGKDVCIEVNPRITGRLIAYMRDHDEVYRAIVGTAVAA